MAITIQTSNSNDKLYASTSSVMSTTCTNNGTNSISVSCGSATATRVEFLPDADGKKYNYSFAIKISWSSGADQQVVFGCSDSSVNGADWVAGTTHLTSSNYVTNPSSITVSRYNSSGSKGGTVTRTTLNNYWIANFGLSPAIADDSQINRTVGSYNNPGIWYWNTSNVGGIGADSAAYRAKIARSVSWTKPSSGTPLYYVAMLWKGYRVDSDYNGALGSVKVISGRATSFIDQSNWWDTSTNAMAGQGNYMKITVHAIYTGGPNPSFATAQNSAKNGATTGMGKDEIEDWAIWWKWDVPSINIHNIKFYEQNKSTLLTDSTTTDYDYYAPEGSKIAYPEDIKINKVDKSLDYNLDGYYKRTGSGSWGTTVLTNLGTVGTSDLSFAQKLSLKESTITFKSNYPSGTTDSTADREEPWKIGDTEYLLSAPSAPIKEGYTYTFNNWWTAASGGTDKGGAGAAYVVPDTDTTLYAHWTSSVNQYTLTTSVNSSTMGSATGGGTYNYNTAHNVTATANTGYQFVNWTLTGGLTGTYTDNPHSITMPAGNVTAKATFEAISYTITYASNGGSSVNAQNYTIATNLTLAAAPTREGYTFAGWKVTTAAGSWTSDTTYTSAQNLNTGNYGNVTLTAQWNINSYTLTTVVDSASVDGEGNPLGTVSGGGTKVYNSSVTITATPNTGYDFVKWVFTGKKTGESTTASTTFNMPAGNVTATASFLVHTYSISYVLGSADVTNPNPNTYTIEDENILLADPIRPGYVFLGWSPQGYIEAGSIGNKTFTANWFKEMGDFTPKPGHDAEDNGDFGIDTSEIDDNEKYQLILQLPGDRSSYPYEYTDGIDYAQYGISVEENKWVYDSGVVTGEELKALLNADNDPSNTNYIFPMDIWRCRINHSRGELTVTLNLYDSAGETILGSTSATREFALESDNKPYITKVELHEGVVNIKNLDLGANNQESTRRFIGNKKSSVLATIFASNIQGQTELLYEAVPCQFIVRLDGMNTDRSDAAWDTGDIEVILTQAQIAELTEILNNPFRIIIYLNN